MARRPIRNTTDQLGFDMGMTLPKPVKQSESAPPTRETPNPEKETPPVLSVGELTHRITNLLEKGIGMVWVEGEISNLRVQASGHAYFTLKDETAQLSCVLFARTPAGQARVELRDGLLVRLYGQISVYQPRGQYQLMVRLVQAKGEGVLQARFEELKRRLASEGLFGQERKRTLPRFPRRIGVVTSPTGAAIRDFLQVLHRRHPGLSVVINPVRVQGKGAADEIASAIGEFSAGSAEIGPVDVIVVTRGGGSLEDLWEFNEEVVARAIAESGIPVVSAVGHEIDFSISDFVADFRAPTPSAAAELLSADANELLDRCRSLVARIGREAEAVVEKNRAWEYRLASSQLFREPLRRLDEARQTADRHGETLEGFLERRVEQLRAGLATLTASMGACHPGRQLDKYLQLVTTLGARFEMNVSHRLENERGKYARLQSALSALSPEATLKRGFSITRNSKGKVITSVNQVSVGDQLRTQLAEGEIRSEASETSD